MKKILLSLMAVLCAIGMNAATTTFDFTQFESVDATGSEPIVAAPFSFVGNNGKVTLTTNGFYTGGSSNATARHIVFTAPADGDFTVQASASGDNTDRYVAICSSASFDDILAKEMMPSKGVRVTTSYNVTAGNTYYVMLYGNGTVTGLTYEEAAGNTITAGKYIAQVTITEAEDVTAPANFKQYVGTHRYGMDLTGDENELTISGLEILNNLTIVGDAVAYDAEKTFTMNGKTFTICSVDGTQTEGTLAITKNEDGTITIEDFGFMKGAKFAGTATDIIAMLQENVETEANITFEDVELAATYYNGADEAGLVATADDFSFMNYYDTEYNSWNGFAVSATRSDIFAGNYKDDTQYNSCMAGGMESPQFAVGYYSEYNALMDDQYPEIYATKNMKPEYAYITNTAAAYISMMYGDNCAKKFTADDYLVLTITGMAGDEEETETGSVDFYLAKDGNIVDEWTKVDLTPLGTCSSIRFSMDSSDKSWGFINTPCYFALDNMKIELTDQPTAVAGVAEAKVAAKAVKTVKNGQIIIVKDGKQYNVAGQEM